MTIAITRRWIERSVARCLFDAALPPFLGIERRSARCTIRSGVKFAVASSKIMYDGAVPETSDANPDYIHARNAALLSHSRQAVTLRR